MSTSEYQLGFWEGFTAPPTNDPWSLDGRPQTVRKLRILEGYLQAYVPIMLRFFGKIYYIDCFAGRGWYHSSLGERDGSPIVAARIAERYGSLSNPARLHCRNIEKSRETFEQLQQRTSVIQNVDIVNLKGTFEDTIVSVLSEVGDAPSFVFVDPYGVKDAKFTQLTVILDHPCELLINFSYMGVARCAGFLRLYLSGTGDSAERRQASANIQILDDLFGTVDWRQIVGDPDLPAGRKEDQLVELYKRQLQTHKKYVISRRLPAPDRETTLYYLVFATDNETGLEKFNDATFSVMRQPFQQRPPEDYLDNFLCRKYQGTVIEWGQVVVDHGERWRSSWLKASLRRLARSGIVTAIAQNTRLGRRNPKFDFTAVGKP